MQIEISLCTLDMEKKVVGILAVINTLTFTKISLINVDKTVRFKKEVLSGNS